MILWVKVNYKEFIFIIFIIENLKFVQIKDLWIQTDGSQGGSHWTCFKIKGEKSRYFDSFGGQPDKFLLNQLAKPIINHRQKNQDLNSQFCGSDCLYFFYLLERMNFYDTFSKLFF